MDVATIDVRAARRAASEVAILDAAVELYAQSGPDGASLRDIAAAAGVTHPLVTRYFGSKDGLVVAVGERLATWLTDEVAADDASTSEHGDRLLPAARADRSMAKLLIRSALGDLPWAPSTGCPLGGRSSPEVDGGVYLDGSDRMSRYAARCLLLGWLTFEGFMKSGARLADTDQPGVDRAMIAAASDVRALPGLDRSTVERSSAGGRGEVQTSRTDRGESRERLLASAIVLFAERGPASVSIRDVARHAGLNQGLLHRHFGSKHDLTIEAIDAGVASLMPGALAPGGFDVDRVVRVMHHDPIPARLIARTLVDEIGIGSVRLRFPLMDGLVSLARAAPAHARPAALDDPRLAAVAAASMVGGSVIWGETLRSVDEWPAESIGSISSVMTELSHHLLGSASR